MNASEAFLNGAASGGAVDADLDLIDALSGGSRLAERRSGERGADEDREQSVPHPDAFQNDPPDPSNPNEVREQHLKKINKIEDQ